MVGIDPSVAAAVALGAAYAAVPGAVNTEAIRRGLAAGVRPALLVQLGSLLGDAVWAAIALGGATVLVQHEAVATALALLGAGFLFGLVRTTVRDAVRPRPVGPLPARTRRGGDLAVGVAFGLANPAGLAFWTGVGGGVLAGSPGGGLGQAAGFLVAFMVGALAWGTAVAVLAGLGRRWVGKRLLRWTDLVCAGVLGVFAIRLLWSGLRRAGRWAPWAIRGLA